MKIIKQSWALEPRMSYDEMKLLVERAGRTCYQSEPQGRADEFIKSIIRRGHESVLEHVTIPVRIITDRGVTHELVRHRIGVAYSQESTRYCNYAKDKFGGEITVILPVWFEQHHDHYVRTGEIFLDSLSADLNKDQYYTFLCWSDAMKHAEKWYLEMLANGQTAQQARAVLPNSLKTEIVVTMNVRAWRHFFQLRAAKAAHPQMRSLAIDMLEGFQRGFPVFFEDLTHD